LRFNHAPAGIVLREASVRAEAYKATLNIRLDKYRVNERKLRPGFLGDVGRPDFRTPSVARPRDILGNDPSCCFRSLSPLVLNHIALIARPTQDRNS
jgi:hypothetical protein